MTEPTALDWLRWTRARGSQLLETIDAYLGDVADVPEVAVDLIAELRELLEPRPLPGVSGHYSDGRPVWDAVDLGQWGHYAHYWHPDPDHPDNRPRELCVARTSGGRYRVEITASGRLEATPTLALCGAEGDR